MEESEFLPERIVQLSLSEDELVLPWDAAVEAIDILEKEGFLILCWEGWLRYADGAVGHSLSHQGSREIRRHPEEPWADFSKRAKQSFTKSASESLQKFTAKPENPGAQLYFCLVFSREAPNA
ncbi:MAG TPA: hypothetical protein VFO10_17155 [Oligoflexus sp.]|uniref:hypothetical protein n=1 Tax=Oligoflexus sp. TaxID=1971216 RepID=UPI002D7F7EF2|nr:hypothetical protein [Oligoflexus sp.]HET9238989.1 hypothetical protein [Oligoflexus sp.]